MLINNSIICKDDILGQTCKRKRRFKTKTHVFACFKIFCSKAKMSIENVLICKHDILSKLFSRLKKGYFFLVARHLPPSPPS